MKFEFVKSHRGLFDAIEMCEALGVSTSGYYRWERSEPSLRRQEDESFKRKIIEIHDRAVGDCGYRPVYRHLLDDGVACGRDRTRRLMNDLKLFRQAVEGIQASGHGQRPRLRLQSEEILSKAVELSFSDCYG